MSRSVFQDLKYKMIDSGNRLNLFLGINTIVFILLSAIHVTEVLFRTGTSIAETITMNLTASPYLPALLFKFWTPFTYMFAHTAVFHFVFNMLWLNWMGRIFTDFLSKRQFTFTYLAGGLAGALLFVLAFNTLPAFKEHLAQSGALIGASASVMAIVAAVATLLPDYSIMLLLFGEVKLKYLAIVYIILDFVLLLDNPGGSFAHLGGAFFGFLYIRQLQKGNDWSRIFQKRNRLKVVSKNKSAVQSQPDQEVIDRILDKISRSGYDSLSKQEKEQLFNASKSNETKK